VESSLIRLLESGAAPWAVVILAFIWAVKSVATRLLRMDPNLVDAFTRWRVTGRMFRRGDGSITPQQAQDMLSLLPLEKPPRKDEKMPHEENA
jgi:hypothetical protein